ncbi:MULTISPECIES: GntR family transcriptional regulator [Rhodococcus]|nr:MULTISPECIES: GntR family transcriptional regulator [Rhodococcus]MDV7243883.1 GntR family transcriptional regulator [Rhodococcus oxybenzonivorans]MDV7274875.1 GntR family transcriptional regulator [Rhodococcus oxybenzonivorans]MDV7345825.1 GntR family transcriptional regulator [Rhodococcus oxybenzonivorans]MDV8028370.1 GntR family transcriptional regulator [Rhodococcus sp. IEGM 27]MDV8101460.1 GntR family transcriptional regulator [Rhodococcus sp. IEGM 69]
MTPMGLQAIEADAGVISRADRVYSAIQDKLIMLDIRPNEAIVESALAEELGVGRTPVREALKRLEGERLVISFPRQGTFATGVDVSDLSHISEIRAHLEPVAARRAAEAASPTLRQLLLDMADKTDGLDVSGMERHELMRWDLTVHRTIYRVARNPHLEDVLVRYDNLATRIFCLYLERLPSVPEHVGEHGELLRAIANGDGDLAGEIARQHVTGFEKAVRAVV